MPAKPRLLDSEVVKRVEDRIHRGQLPCLRPETVYGGFGSGRTACSGCEQVIESGKVEYEIEDPQSKVCLSFHFDCYVIWQRECLQRLDC
jgi:hypothetical protein